MAVFQVTIGNEVKTYEQGTTYKSIAAEYQDQYDAPIVLVYEDQYHLQELRREVHKNCSLSFITTADKIGYDTYRRSVCFLMFKAIHDVGGHHNSLRTRILFSFASGYFCSVEGNVSLNREFLKQVEERMKKLVADVIPLGKRSLQTDDAISLFHKHGMIDKERLFRYRRVSKVNIYNINEFEDYFYGYMVPDTSYLPYFSLIPYKDGFVIQIPSRANPGVVPPFVPSEKLFYTLKESVKFCDDQNVETIGALNDMVTKSDMREVVLVQEAYHERKIAEIAKEIAGRPEIKFVLIAGPSSSGKTTFSHRLSIQLRTNGLIPHPIAVDNYFVDREKTPKDEFGKFNFECIEAIDVDAFNKDMLDLLAGKAVHLRLFNFKSGTHSFEDKAKILGEHDILVIEGIHCLNPKLTSLLSDSNKFKIYISALTQLNIDEHNLIPSREGRLIRRIVRDARTRGISAKTTIDMWPSVRRGEDENIFPFQEEADVIFNSSLPYELAVLKLYLEPLLFGIEKDTPEYVDAKKLLKFFDYFVGIGSEHVPTTSLLREFIGGGVFLV